MLLRLILITHRYVAVAVGLLMALWCLSGFVMMYQGFPSFTPAERLASLAPLEMAGCCSTGFLPDDGEPLKSFRIEMLRGEPVLRQSGTLPIRLVSGTPIEPFSQRDLLQIAADYALRRGLADATPEWLGEVAADQWSIQSARANQPAQHLALHDAADSEIYINGTTGEVFQDTNRRERVLAWFGAIPHWLYPTALRANGPLWSQVVIWTATLGTFLTVTGLYVGIARLRRRRDGRLGSPFRGWWYWHHILGLVFGALTLTWVFSGLMTMTPWGLLQTDGGAALRAQLRGSATTGELRRFLETAPAQLAGRGFVQLQGEAAGGKLQVIARRADGSTLRLDADGLLDPLQAGTVQQWLAALGSEVASFERLDAPDTYYYGRSASLELPVYRVILADAEHTRLYISPTTGAVRVVDGAIRQSRWLISAMHNLELPGLGSRPLWDIVTLLLLAGVTAVTITGSWMALKRIRADLTPRA
ncbi:MAG: PepSY domain-containing protein [Steroidobacteraceae bacterium]